MHILYAEDEHALSEAVSDILSHHHYMLDVVDNGTDALAYGSTQHYDVIILDVMMPGLDGVSVIRELRAKGVKTPTLLLTAKGEVEDRVMGLDAGADDYLPKPFSMKELLARVRALSRRRDSFTPDQLQVGNLILDQKRALLSCGNQVISLSRLEYRLLELLMTYPGMTFSASHLLERVWGTETDTDVNEVWVYISYLRKKLSALHADVMISSRRSIGYLLEVRK